MEKKSLFSRRRTGRSGKRYFFILASLVSLLLWTGCQPGFQRSKLETNDPFDSQTEEMRRNVERVKHQQPATSVIYGGMSNEAKAIEESLYGK